MIVFFLMLGIGIQIQVQHISVVEIFTVALFFRLRT